MASEPDADASTFDAYVLSRGRSLWRAAYLLTGDPHSAEDLVQTALSRTFRHYDGIGSDAAFGVCSSSQPSSATRVRTNRSTSSGAVYRCSSTSAITTPS